MSTRPHPLGLKAAPMLPDQDMAALDAAAEAIGDLIGSAPWGSLGRDERDQLRTLAGAALIAYRRAGGALA